MAAAKPNEIVPALMTRALQHVVVLLKAVLRVEA
jgi:hypothetical protein